MRSWLSPTAWWKCESPRPRPDGRPTRPSWCRRSGRAGARCPTATISILMRGASLQARRPSIRYWNPVASVRAAATQIAASCRCGGGPAEGRGRSRWPGPGRASSAWPSSGPGWTRRVDPPTSGRRCMPTSRTAMRMTGQPGQVPLGGQGEERTEHHRLVGQGVQEGPGPGGALAAGHVPIDPVAAGHDEARRPR